MQFGILFLAFYFKSCISQTQQLFGGVIIYYWRAPLNSIMYTIMCVQAPEQVLNAPCSEYNLSAAVSKVKMELMIMII